MSRFVLSPIWTNLLTASLGLSLAGPSSAQAGAWTHHKGVGFDIDAPPGWSVESAKDGHILVHSADRTMFAVLQPFRAPSGGSSAQWISPLVLHMKNIFPSARISDTEQISASPDRAIARIIYSGHSGPGHANVLCYIHNGSGMFSAIAAPANQFATDKPILIKAMESFHSVPSGIAHSDSHHAGSAGPVSFYTWTEPMEKAFTCQIPAGWKAFGGMYRLAPIDLRPQVNVASPDGAILIQIGDAHLPTFTPQTQITRMQGKQPGSVYQTNGVTYAVLDYADGAQFARFYLEKGVYKVLHGLRVGETRNRPDLAEAYNQANARNGQPTNDSVGQADFTFEKNGATRHGTCIARTSRIGQGVGSIWTAHPIIAIGSPDRADEIKQIITRMVGSIQVKPDWSSKQRQITAQFNDLIRRDYEEGMRQVRAQYARASQQLDDSTRHFDNILNNETDAVNRDTGEKLTAPGLHDYYWQKGNTVVGTDINEAPGGFFTPLDKY